MIAAASRIEPSSPPRPNAARINIAVCIPKTECTIASKSGMAKNTPDCARRE